MSVVEGIVLAVVALFAIASAVHHLLPSLAMRIRRRIAALLQRTSMPAFLRRFGRWLQPAATGDKGCGSGCSACAGCPSARDGTSQRNADRSDTGNSRS